ncbi:hypothetical protein K7432_011936 [Basidiobolus ranarum]|uniref:F-box domain-containing protein n=1 Tax=Basidiobolus ranarum TaxID=34480 RepID=A0ABR2VTM1_9FUNG
MTKKYSTTRLLCLPIVQYPTEIIAHILSFLDLNSLITTRICSRNWYTLCMNHIAMKIRHTSVSLTFEQEGKWRFTVDFGFSSYDEATSRVVYKVKTLKTRRCFYGILLENPKVTSIQLAPYSSMNITPNRSFPVKKEGIFLGLPSSHTANERWALSYRVSKTPPSLPEDLEPIGGERWITPLTFECSLEFMASNFRPSFLQKVVHLFPSKRLTLLPSAAVNPNHTPPVTV